MHDIHPCEATAATRHLSSSLRCVDPCLAVTKFVRTADLTDGDGGEEEERVGADAVSTAAALQEIPALTLLVTRRASIQHTLQHLCTMWRGEGPSLTCTSAAAASDFAFTHARITPAPAPVADSVPVVVIDNWDDDEPVPVPVPVPAVIDDAAPGHVCAAATTTSAITDTTAPIIDIESMGTVYHFLMDRCAALRQQLVRVTSAHAAFDTSTVTVTGKQPEEEKEKEKERAMLRFVYVQICSLYLEMLHRCASGTVTKDISNVPTWYDPYLHFQSLQNCVSASAMIPVPGAVACAFQDQLRQLSRSLQVRNAVTRAFAPLVLVAQATQAAPSTPARAPATATTPAPATAPGSAGSEVFVAAVAAAAVAALSVVLPVSLANLQIQAATEAEVEAETGAVMHTHHQPKPSTPSAPSAQDILLNLCGHLKRSNISGAMSGVMRAVQRARCKHTTDTAPAAEGCIPSSFAAYVASLPLFLQALLPIMPYLRLHRMLLLCGSANRGEVLSVNCIAKRLYLDDDVACLRMLRILRLPVSAPTDISDSSTSSIGNSDIGCYQVVLRPLLPARGATLVPAAGACVAGNTYISIQQACNALDFLQKCPNITM
jgi:hypothetical protein